MASACKRIAVAIFLGWIASTALAADDDSPKATLELYGFIKLDAAYDDSRVNPGNFARWVESESILPDDSQFSMTANQTRVGVEIKGRPGKVATNGKLEIDFYGGGGENKSNPMLRHAFVSFAWPEKDLTVIAGQTSDIISPLVVPTVNYSAGWWQGNIGYRRPQIRVTKGFRLPGEQRLKLDVGPTRTISDTTFVIGTIDSGADAAVPTIQARLGLESPHPSGDKISIGLSGHWGEEDQHMTDMTGAITGHRRVDTWSVNLDFRIPVSSGLLVQGEWFRGENLLAYLGGIGQDGETETGGGWLAATLRPGPRWRFHVGAGIDDPDDADLVDADARTRNAMVFANADHFLTSDLTLSFEWMVLDTRYLGRKEGDAHRQQVAIRYVF